MKLLAVLAAAAAFCATAGAAPVVDRAVPAAPAPIAAPVPRATVFSGDGLLVAAAGSVDPRWLGDRMHAARLSWVAVELADGTEERNADALNAGWAERLRERGIAVGGWSVLREDPVRDAAAAASLLARYRLGFYVADAEFEYSRLVDPSRSAAFVAAFAARAPPALPRALSSFGRVDGDYGLDWRAWRDGGYEYLPQSYIVDGAAFAPCLSVAAGLTVWPRAGIHPTIGIYGGLGLAAYDGCGLEQGFSIFPGELLSDADFARLAGR